MLDLKYLRQFEAKKKVAGVTKLNQSLLNMVEKILLFQPINFYYNITEVANLHTAVRKQLERITFLM